MTLGLPPLNQLLKSREVEDPMDLWVHRPAAYAFVWAVFRTGITPTHVTLLAALTGLVAAAMWFWGTPGAMVAGGIVLWGSATFDDADGMLARAKDMQSESGRALDGFLDAAVGAVVAVAGLYHCYVRTGDPIYWYVAPLLITTTWFHVHLYDFFKESYLRFTSPGGSGDGADVPQIKRQVADLEARDGDLLTRLLLKYALINVLRVQYWAVSITNPAALRHCRRFTVTGESAKIYRRHNLGPMRLWALISLTPHTSLMAVFGIFDNLEAYVWIRLILVNLLFIIVVLWQRSATCRTLEEDGRPGRPPQAGGLPH